jgi:AAHS family 3-hydroxyphenylpropionic acid transporter
MDRTSGRSTAAITVALCYLVALCEGFDLQAAGVAAPALGPAFHMSPQQLSWFFSASTFGLLIGAAAGGRLSDRFGRKPILLFSVAVFGVMSLLTSLALGPQTLLAARFLTGAGIGGALPNLVALTAENTAPERKNTAVGMLYAGLPSGGALASLTAMLGGAHDWRTVFAVGGIAPLIAVPLLFFVLPESQALARSKQAAPSGSPSGFGAAVFAEGRALRSLLLWIGFFLSLLTMYLLLNWLPTLLVGRGLSRPDASLVQIAFGSAAVALLLLAGAPPALAASVVVGALVGATMSANQAALYAVAPAVYPTAVRGAGVGLAVSIGRLGSAAGPLLAGVLLGSGKSPQQVLLVLVPIILIAGLAALLLSLVMKRPASSGVATAT